jgi:hypothetical protein
VDQRLRGPPGTAERTLQRAVCLVVLALEVIGVANCREDIGARLPVLDRGGQQAKGLRIMLDGLFVGPSCACRSPDSHQRTTSASTPSSPELPTPLLLSIPLVSSYRCATSSAPSQAPAGAAPRSSESTLFSLCCL